VREKFGGVCESINVRVGVWMADTSLHNTYNIYLGVHPDVVSFALGLP